MSDDDVVDLTQELILNAVSADDDHVVDLTQGLVLDPSSASTSKISASGRPKRRSVVSAEEKMKKTATASLEKQAKKQKMAAERTAKKTASDMKIYKPGECMKYMTVEAHPSLLGAWYMGDAPRELTAAGARVSHAAALCHPALLTWTRAVPRALAAQQGQVTLTPGVESCARALYVSTAEELVELVEQHALAPHLAHIRDLVGCQLTLVVFGAKDYFKSSRRKNSSRQKMTDISLETALTDVLVTAACDAALVESPGELAMLILHLTKAIAEAPYKKAKRACDELAEFYMRGDNKKCVAVDKDGVGVGRLWQQMLAVLPLSSLETSRALCAQYKSPLALYEALQSPEGVTEVSEVGVSRAAVPGAKTRRVGREFARKLHTLFTAQDGNVLVD